MTLNGLIRVYQYDYVLSVSHHPAGAAHQEARGKDVR